MKILVTAVLILSSIYSYAYSYASDFTLEQLSEKYKVTSQDPRIELGPGISVHDEVSINPDGTIILIQNIVQTAEGQAPYILESVSCAGKATLEAGLLTSNVTCQNGSDFSQVIDLNNIKGDFADGKFSAPVHSSLYNLTAQMDFEKIKS